MKRALPVMLGLLLLILATRGTPPADAVPSGLVRIEAVHGTRADLPIVVAIHGLGDRPQSFARLLGQYESDARLVFPQGPAPYGEGWSWFETRIRERGAEVQEAEVGRAADEAADLLRELMAAHPRAGKPIVTGFSQGGMLAFTLAVRHPSLVRTAIPLAGWLPPSLLPQELPQGAPPIRALHGDLDTVLPLAPTLQGVDQLRALGWDARIKVYEGVEHRMTLAMRADLYTLLDEAAALAP